MNRYEEMLELAAANGLIVKEKPLTGFDGRIKGNRIAIRSTLATTAEKTCTLMEEFAHMQTSVGDILDQSNTGNCKQEYRARLWGYDQLVGLSGLVEAFEAGCRSRFEMAEYLEVTEEYLTEMLEAYHRKYGLCAKVDDCMIFFDPCFDIMKTLE